jgi:ClpP class serine protease
MPAEPPATDGYSPYYEAQHAPRFQRRDLIRSYEEEYACRLIVVSDAIFPYSVALWEELLSDIARDATLHVMLNSPGGDGETAIRLVRSAQQHCQKLVIVLPDQAKSAATLLTLGAHEILMGPASDLGPVDPQFLLPEKGLVSAKSIIAAVDEATVRVQAAPETYPLWASLVSDVTAIMYQQARAAIARTGDQMREALASNPERTPAKVKELVAKLKGPLIDETQSHGAVFSASDALQAGLPVTQLGPEAPQWRAIWRLWTRYIMLGNVGAYESTRASQVFPKNQ